MSILFSILPSISSRVTYIYVLYIYSDHGRVTYVLYIQYIVTLAGSLVYIYIIHIHIVTKAMTTRDYYLICFIWRQ